MPVSEPSGPRVRASCGRRRRQEGRRRQGRVRLGGPSHRVHLAGPGPCPRHRARRENTDVYGRHYAGLELIWEVVSQEETEDYYEIRLSHRPAEGFRGEPGLEQITMDKAGRVRLRQILSRPVERRRAPLILVAVALIVTVGAVVSILFASGVFTAGLEPTEPPVAILPSLIVTTTAGPSLLAAPTDTPTPTLVLTSTATPSPTPVLPTPTASPSPTVTVSPTPAPTSLARIGDTVALESNPELDLTLLSWRESKESVNGPYISGYYTFTALPGMKFVILYYRFTNTGIREQRTPYLSDGEILTDPERFYYKIWSPIGGANSTEYDPRQATEAEVGSLGGDSGASWPK